MYLAAAANASARGAGKSDAAIHGRKERRSKFDRKSVRSLAGECAQESAGSGAAGLTGRVRLVPR